MTLVYIGWLLTSNGFLAFALSLNVSYYRDFLNIYLIVLKITKMNNEGDA